MSSHSIPKDKCCIFDFDSTIVSIETLDFLISSTSQNQQQEIEEITNLAMGGKLSFADSLKLRFTNIDLTSSDIEKLKSKICNYITDGFFFFIEELRKDFDLYIISGGFIEIIEPVAQKLGISIENCFANKFVFDGNKVVGYDQNNVLSDNGGKSKIINQILTQKNYDKIFMIGDGYTDLEVTKANPNIIFCGFGVHIVRESVKKEAPNFFYNLEELKKFISNPT